MRLAGEAGGGARGGEEIGRADQLVVIDRVAGVAEFALAHPIGDAAAERGADAGDQRRDAGCPAVEQVGQLARHGHGAALGATQHRRGRVERGVELVEALPQWTEVLLDGDGDAIPDECDLEVRASDIEAGDGGHVGMLARRVGSWCDLRP